MSEPVDVRPRLGQITHADGTETPVVFMETDTAGQFLAARVDGGPVVFRQGDRLYVDVLGPGQSVAFHPGEASSGGAEPPP